MPTVTTRDRAKLQVISAGTGQDIVLVSGLGGTAKFWSPLIDALGTDVRTVCFDQRGIGDSERGQVDVSIQSLAEDTWQIIDALNISQPVLWGHSTGGAIVQKMTLMRQDQVPAMVLSGSWAGPDWFMERMFKLRLELLNTNPGRYTELSALLASPPRWLNENSEVVQNSVQQVLPTSHARIVKERICALLAHDCRDQLSKIEIPSLVLGAEDDIIVPPYLQEEIAGLLEKPHLCILSHGGHFFPVTRPAVTAEKFQNWLQQIQTEGTALRRV